jgi:aldehyde:ferredoxin oxidoreductase
MTKKIIGGYNGKILRVNLSENAINTETLDELFCRRYIGGAGFVIYYLWKELKPGIDALAPDNKLMFALGPVSGLQLPGAARNCIGAKSPLTGGIAKSEAGGFWAAELKRAGFDAIIVEGRAEKPVYLCIQDGQAVLKDAGHIWGKETKETQETIRAELGDNHIQLASIGPAGENMVRYACIMHGLHDTAGRGGLGAVMGSKNLKAIAVRGHKLPKIYNGQRVKEIRQQVIANPHPISQFGTGGPELMIEESYGNLPVRNFRDGLFPEVKQIHGGAIKDTIRIGMEGCFACPVRCKKVVESEEPYRIDSVYGGPEYESIAALGSDCGIGNLKAICKGNERCNAYSLDTLSTGSTIAFAMECFEKGLLNTQDTGGIDLKFGNHEAMLEAIELIARRQGIGDLLAEGTARLAKKVGKGSEEFAMHVKGLEPGMHEPRLKKNMGLMFMLNPQGADHACGPIEDYFAFGVQEDVLHRSGMHLPLPIEEDVSPRKAAVFKLEQCRAIVEDSLVMCIIVPFDYALKAELVTAVTGWDMSVMELFKAAERTLTVARLFNIREGLTAADDTLPERFFQPKTDGVLSTKRLDRSKLERARNYYYTLMGWDSKGIPLPEKVEELYIE